MKLSVEKMIPDHFLQGDTKKSSQYLRSTASRGHLADLNRKQEETKPELQNFPQCSVLGCNFVGVFLPKGGKLFYLH